MTNVNTDSWFHLFMILSNIAGVAASINEKFEVWEEAIATNLTSVMYLSKAVLPHLEESVKVNGDASLIVTSSVLGQIKNGPFAPCTSLTINLMP
jgi:NAD(P)-dependent dehydrogenase (short-subunit alcohol dehydrogenase family)